MTIYNYGKRTSGKREGGFSNARNTFYARANFTDWRSPVSPPPTTSPLRVKNVVAEASTMGRFYCRDPQFGNHGSECKPGIGVAKGGRGGGLLAFTQTWPIRVVHACNRATLSPPFNRIDPGEIVVHPRYVGHPLRKLPFSNRIANFPPSRRFSRVGVSLGFIGRGGDILFSLVSPVNKDGRRDKCLKVFWPN